MTSINFQNQEARQPALSVRDKFKKLSEKKLVTESETWPDYLKRNVYQNLARATEVIGGLPGNLKKSFQQTKEFLTSGEESRKLEEEAFGKPEKGSFEEFVMNPPTSSDIRENMTPSVAKMIGGKETYLEPHSKGEEALGELTQDITSFFMPGTQQMRMMTRIGAPIVGNLTKQGIKYLGADETTAEKAKLGVMLATTLAGQSRPGEYGSQRIQQAIDMIPDTATVNVGPLANRLMPLYQRMTRGLNVPSKSRAMQGMRDLAGQVQNNRMPLRSLMDARDNVNEWISEAGGWDIPVNTRDATIRNLNDLKRSIIQTIDENLAQRFPQASELYRTGYEARAVYHQSNAISNFIERNFGRKFASVSAKLLFPAVAGGGAVFPKVGVTAAAAYPFYKTGQVLYRIGRSPTLARYYQDVITNSTIGNVPAMVKSMEKLDKALHAEEQKQKKGLSLEEFKGKFKKKG